MFHIQDKRPTQTNQKNPLSSRNASYYRKYEHQTLYMRVDVKGANNEMSN